MAEKNLNSRIVHKHDIEVNWSKATNFIPKIGEIIVYDPDENHSAARVKIGDGVKTVVELAFIDDAAKAALFKEIDMVDEKVEALGQLVGDASIPEQIEEALLKTQADWEVNDETSAAYVKNRTHWVETNRVVIANQQTVECTIDRYLPAEGNIVHTSPLVDGHTYLFILNGTEYTGIALYDSSIDAIDVHVDSVDENDLLDSMIYYPDVDQLTIFTNVEDSFSIVIYEIHDIVHQLDPKFIPDTIARVSDLAFATTEEVYAMMLEEGALPVIQTEDGAVLTIASNEILMI